MPRRRSSIKRSRVDEKKHLRNIRVKTRLKKTLKKFQGLLTAKNSPEAKTFMHKVFSELDKAAKKKIIHSRTADRKKSRIALSLKKAA
jgi:small subunit ribosomal protein S20